MPRRRWPRWPARRAPAGTTTGARMPWDSAGQRRLLDLAARGEVLDDNLYTTPGRFGGGGAATTWLVGSAADVARSLGKYRDRGVTHFILSDTPYLREIERQGRHLLLLLRG